MASLPSNFKPMLAFDYCKKKKYISFPCYVQPKLDGIRGIYYRSNMWSRTGKLFYHFHHIIDAITALVGSSDIILDGELFSYEMPFEELSGLVRKKHITETDIAGLNKICYIIYDCTIPNMHYADRLSYLHSLLQRSNKFLHLIDTKICASAGSIQEYHNMFVDQGYEGLIIRNMQGVYEYKRSNNLQKLKAFEDGEFTIIGYTDGEGQETGLIIFICETKNHQPFHVRPTGTHEMRHEMFLHGDDYIGKRYTVRYQELTKNGIPRFGVGVGVRDYE